MTATKTNVRLVQSDDNSNSLGAKKPFRKLIIKRLTNFFRTKILIKLYSKEIHLHPGIWVFPGEDKTICKINSPIIFGNSSSKRLNNQSFHTLMPEIEKIVILRLLKALSIKY